MKTKHCPRGWRVSASREVIRWLRRHPEAKELLRDIQHELGADPYIGEPLRGRCSGLYKYRRGRLRVMYWLDKENCTVRLFMVDYRERVYDKLSC